MTFALDSDTFALLAKGHARVTARFAEVVAAGMDEITVPAVVRAEALRGRFDALTKAPDGAGVVAAYDLLVRTEAALAPFRVLPVTRATGNLFDRLKSGRKTRKGTHADLLIACIVLANGATLVTRNTKDFIHIPGLKLDNWAA